MRLRRLARDVASGCYSCLITAQIIFWLYLCFGISVPSHQTSHAEQNYGPQVIQVKSVDTKGQNVVSKSTHVDEKLSGPDNRDTDNGHSFSTPSEHSSGGFHNGSDVMKRYYSSMLGHTILPRDTSVIFNGTYLRNPTSLCSQHEDLDLVVVVHSSPYNFDRRRLMRHTFRRQVTYTPYTVQLVFMIGTHNMSRLDPRKEANLSAENTRYGDFVQMDFNEDFRNLSLKAVMWLKWLYEHCQNPSVILKIDDDVLLDLRRILPLSVGYFSKFKRSIFCHLNKLGTQPIPRIGRTKVDMREFFNITIYPYNYCSGFIVFLSQDMIALLMSAARKTPFYNVDDLYMFGMLPKMLGNITYHNIGYNVSVWNQKVYNCSLRHGTSCPYYGTMSEDSTDALNLLKAFDRAHRSDFHIPRLTVLK